jgi:hypothetical protein
MRVRLPLVEVSAGAFAGIATVRAIAKALKHRASSRSMRLNSFASGEQTDINNRGNLGRAVGSHRRSGTAKGVR